MFGRLFGLGSGETGRIWKRLATGRGMDRMGLDMIEGRVAVVDLNVPPRRLESAVKSSAGTFRKFSGTTRIKEAHWEKICFTSSDLSHLKMFDCNVTDCVFEHCTLRGFGTWGSGFEDVAFRSTDMRAAVLGGVTENRRNTFRNVRFVDCDLRGLVCPRAGFTNCRFENCRLDKVEFGSSTFEDCAFAGELNGVNFYRRAWDQGDFPENEMRRVDFSRARLRWCAFRWLDMTDVRFPNDGEHIVVENFPDVLDLLIGHFGGRQDSGSKGLVGDLTNQRERCGGPHSVGVLNKADLFDLGGSELVEEVVQVLRDRVD